VSRLVRFEPACVVSRTDQKNRQSAAAEGYPYIPCSPFPCGWGLLQPITTPGRHRLHSKSRKCTTCGWANHRPAGVKTRRSVCPTLEFRGFAFFEPGKKMDGTEPALGWAPNNSALSFFERHVLLCTPFCSTLLALVLNDNNYIIIIVSSYLNRPLTYSVLAPIEGCN
jgi:hypothetical protein